MAKKRTPITSTPAPKQPRQVQRGGKRISVSQATRRKVVNRRVTREGEQPWTLGADQEDIRSQQGGFAHPGEFIEKPWTPPNQNRMPKSKGAIDFPGYRGPGPNPFPKYDPYREHEEADLFAESELGEFGGDNGDFIPLTYSPTKTSWPANGWDHRRTVAAGYFRARGLLRVQFYTDGAIYDYGILHPVGPEVAHAFRLAQSPGRYINDVLEGYGYARVN